MVSPRMVKGVCWSLPEGRTPVAPYRIGEMDGDQSRWPNEQSTRLQFWEIRESEDHGFKSGAHGLETWSSQTKETSNVARW